MTTPHRPSPVHLFTIRLWAEDINRERVEWRSKAQHILASEAPYFRSWQQLIDYLTATLSTEERLTMTTLIPTAGVHHIALTVSDVRRSQQLYSDVLGFNFLTDFGPKALPD